MTFRRLHLGVMAMLVGLSGAVLLASPTQAASASQVNLMLPGAGVSLDATLYLPKKTPAPAILLAHGFGGTKNSVVTEAKTLQSRGYVVLAWTARGFGNSTGTISMDSPDGEVADVSKLIDYLATRSEVIQDGLHDPRVGITGGSYGGAIALLAAGYNPRIDAVAADITWNDLQGALFPQSAVNVNQPGPFKRVWTGTFFSIGSLGVPKDPTQPDSLLCGRFAPEWCAAYQASVATSAPTPEISKLMRASSPSSIAARIKVPTLLMQGEADSLFPLSESALTANEIRRAHPSTPLAMVWHGSGHDGGPDESKHLDNLVGDWFDIHLKGMKKTFPVFQVTQSAAAISSQDSAPEPRVFLSSVLPMDAPLTALAVQTGKRILIAPIGAVPASVSTLPGLGSALSFAGGFGAFLPGQSAFFDSRPLTSPLVIVGSSKVRVRVTSSAKDATLFFSLVIRGASGRTVQPSGLVAPVRLTDIPANGTAFDLTLPSIVASAAAGDRIAVAVSTTDLGYSMPSDGRIYQVQILSPNVEIPTMVLRTAPGTTSLFLWPLIALLVIALSVSWVLLRRPRRPVTHLEPRLTQVATTADAPFVAVRNLSKTYADGYQAVIDLSFAVERGQIVGLLGPNGAGKTTTLRMMMGLIFPTAGDIEIDGIPVYPGSPALAQLGSFVEGPGFLPHLSGRDNLDLYWRSTGRSEDPEIEDALHISGLGSAIDKKVRSYSQGMRQRLAIAQAMLGKPHLLVLDEPTNGLDPTQIKAMRDVVRNYAASGRTVIVSSHLLAEVEQTCSHVVVMHRGALIAYGTIEEILNRTGKRAQHLEDIFMDLVGNDTEIGL